MDLNTFEVVCINLLHVIFATHQMMLNRSHSNLSVIDLRTCIRTILGNGEILPGMELYLQRRIATGNLSAEETSLLSILQDAIQDGCIRRVDMH
jgi:hypothetical protein